VTWWTWAVIVAIVVVFPGSLLGVLLTARKIRPEVGELRPADGGGFEEWQGDRWQLLPPHPPNTPPQRLGIRGLCEHDVSMLEPCWRCEKGIPARPARHRDGGDRP
jgi:hypothetical protein